ncbi:hypothetical protein ACJX0J_001908 (mitochondrion) [Zea mays]
MDGMGRRWIIWDRGRDGWLPLFVHFWLKYGLFSVGSEIKAIKDAHLRKFNADHIDGKVHNCENWIAIISGTFTLLYFTLLYSSNHTITIIFPLEMVFCAKTTSSDFAEGNSNLDFEYLPNYFLVGEEPISFHLTHSILFKEDSLSDSRDMQASWAGHLKEIKRVRVLVRVTTSGSTLHTSEHWTAEKVHLSGIYLLHNAHATNDKVEAHSDEEDGELINNPILLVGYEYALVVVIAAGLVLTVGQL